MKITRRVVRFSEETVELSVKEFLESYLSEVQNIGNDIIVYRNSTENQMMYGIAEFDMSLITNGTERDWVLHDANCRNKEDRAKVIDLISNYVPEEKFRLINITSIPARHEFT